MKGDKMGKQKTDEEFKKEFYDKFPNSSVNIIGNYINARTKIECKCKKCNLEWNTIPDNLLKNTGCPKCAKTKYNTESFKEKYYKKYPETNVLIMGVNAKNVAGSGLQDQMFQIAEVDAQNVQALLDMQQKALRKHIIKDFQTQI